METIQGRLLILAGAGSGKTRVLTFRMAHLIQHHHVSPEKILGVTFTNKAASEMRERMGHLVGKETASQMTLSTFHSLCMYILRRDIHKLGFTTQFTLYDEQDMQRLVKLIARDILSHESELPSLASVMHTISLARNRGLAPEEIPPSGNPWLDEFNQTLYRRLDHALRAYNALDFDSLLSLTVRLLKEHPDVLAFYQDHFQYIMVDEYQDTNPIQYQLAHLLSQKHGNLCVVGDDDQSIYGWRGADVTNILNFGDERATVVKLEQNYRSTNVILSAANAVISTNTERHAKKLWSDRKDGRPIEVFHAPDDAREAQAVAYRISMIKKQAGLKWSDIAILYRSNMLSRQMEQALLKQGWSDHGRWVKGIPYKIFGGTEFYERKEVKDILAYLRVIANPRDQEAILRVINQPRRGIGESALGYLRDQAQNQSIPLWQAMTDLDPKEITPRASHGVASFVAAIRNGRQDFAHLPLSEALARLLEKIDYQRAIQEEVKSPKMRQFKWENVQELVNALFDFSSSSQEKPTLEGYLSTVSLDRQNHQSDQEQVDVVNLMTFHSSKGLEFPAVFLIGLEDHIMPHERSLAEGGIEEERRLMYVAITRAKSYLCCSMARQRARMGKTVKTKPSRFMYEIPRELIEAKPWEGS